MNLPNSKTCEVTIFGAGVVAAVAAYSIPEMRFWFAAWAIAFPLLAVGLFIYRKR